MWDTFLSSMLFGVICGFVVYQLFWKELAVSTVLAASLGGALCGTFAGLLFVGINENISGLIAHMISGICAIGFVRWFGIGVINDQ